MDPPAGPQIRVGQPRSEHDAAFLERFDKRMRLPLIVSAILPLLIVPESGNWVGIVVGVITWLVFLVDYVVQSRRIQHFVGTGYGRFDLFVVVVTAPWFLLPGAQVGSFVVLLRLARLARLVMASRGAHRLFARLGRIVGIGIGVTIVASLVAYHAEHATNPEFATVGDALWWGIVTITTVGYGDIVPKTAAGRWAGVVIMVTGIAVLGVLAGSLASFFRLDSDDDGSSSEPRPRQQPVPAGPAQSSDSVLASLAAEVGELRRQIMVLSAHLAGGDEDLGVGRPRDEEDP